MENHAAARESDWEMKSSSIFLTGVSEPGEITAARLLIDSIQTFGDEMNAAPIWVFAAPPHDQACREWASKQVQVIPLSVPEAAKNYPFAAKVFACARAEELAPASIRSLTWLDSNCLVVQPPLLFNLGAEFDAALRPVHIRNVGLPPSTPLDTFWKGICAAIGVDDIHITVKSFVDGQTLRAYFNSHGLAVNPALGLFQRWVGGFTQLVADSAFQAAACADDRHRIFLFQALFSVLIASALEPDRLRLLPPTYNYPYNLHGRIPPQHRATALNDLVCFTYEERAIHPNVVTDIQIHEPLRSWLGGR
jgi:hypothetical protein